MWRNGLSNEVLVKVVRGLFPRILKLALMMPNSYLIFTCLLANKEALLVGNILGSVLQISLVADRLLLPACPTGVILCSSSVEHLLNRYSFRRLDLLSEV